MHAVGRRLLVVGAVLVIVSACITFIGGFFGVIFSLGQASHRIPSGVPPFTMWPPEAQFGMVTGVFGFLGFASGLVAAILCLRRRLKLSMAGIILTLSSGFLQLVNWIEVNSTYIVSHSVVILVSVPTILFSLLSLVFLASYSFEERGTN